MSEDLILLAIEKSVESGLTPSEIIEKFNLSEKSFLKYWRKLKDEQIDPITKLDFTFCHLFGHVVALKTRKRELCSEINTLRAELVRTREEKERAG